MSNGIQTSYSAVDEYVLRFSRLKDGAFNQVSSEQRLVELMRNTERHLEEFCGKDSLPLERIVQLRDTIERGLKSLEANVSAIIQERRYKVEDQLTHFSQNDGIEFFGDTDYYTDRDINSDVEYSNKSIDPMLEIEYAASLCPHRFAATLQVIQGDLSGNTLGDDLKASDIGIEIELCSVTPPDGYGAQPLPDIDLDFSSQSLQFDRRFVNYTIDFDAFIYHYGGQNIPDIIIDF